MLLCIEVYPCGSYSIPSVTTTSTSSHHHDDNHNTDDDEEEKCYIQPVFVQYASLAYTNNNNGNNNTVNDNQNNDNKDGIIWSLGRRSGNYHLTSDKSVSREHCRIRIASTNPEHFLQESEQVEEKHKKTTKRDSNNDDNKMTKYGCNPMRPPNNKKKNSINSMIDQECQLARDQLCVVIENVGKLGTYIIQEEIDTEDPFDSRDKSKKDDNHNDDSNNESETEDEMDPVVATGKTQSKSGFYNSSQTQKVGKNNEDSQQNVPISAVSQHLLNCRKAKGTIQPIIGINEMAILHPLTLLIKNNHNNNNNNNNINNNNNNINDKTRYLRRVIIQVGKLGSTIVITRMPTIYFFSSGPVGKEQLSLYEKYLYRMGATVYNYDHNNNTERRPIDEIFQAKRFILEQQQQSKNNKQNNNNNNNNNNMNDPKQFMKTYYSASSEVCYILLTAKYMPCIKQLLAWHCQIPIVSPTFLQALFQPPLIIQEQQQYSYQKLPLPSDHTPEPDTFTFWTDKQPNSHLWDGLPMISFVPAEQQQQQQQQQQPKLGKQYENDFDLEQLVQSAGVDILTISLPNDKKLNDSQLVQYIKNLLNDHNSNHHYNNNLYFIAQQETKTSALTSKVEKLLLRSLPNLISKVTNKQIAKCITSQSLLLPDLQQEQQKQIQQQQQQPQETREKDETMTRTKSQNPDTKNNNTRSNSRQGESMISVSKNMEEDGDDDHEQKEKANNKNDRKVTASASTTRRSSPRRSKNESIQQSAPRTGGRRSARQQKAADTDTNVGKQQQQHDDDDQFHNTHQNEESMSVEGVDEKSKNLGVPSRNITSSHVEVNEEIVTNNKRKQSKLIDTTSAASDIVAQEPSKKMKKTLETSSLLAQGWVTALPKSKKLRKDFIRSKEEIQKVTGSEEVRDVAPTEKVKGLVIVGSIPQQQQIPSNNADGNSISHKNYNHSNNNGKPDFKLFRKNSIIAVTAGSEINDQNHYLEGIGINHSRPRPIIRFRSVLPKESDNQRDLEEQQKALEEQQRRADELFRDHGPSKYRTVGATNFRKNQRR